MSGRPLQAPTRMIELEVDGQPVRVFEVQTILDALRKLGVETPTLCYGDTLQPAVIASSIGCTRTNTVAMLAMPQPPISYENTIMSRIGMPCSCSGGSM